jgi:hypothetical protein
MIMPDTLQSPEEIARRGEELYQQQIRAKVEASEQNIGKMIVVDVKTGDYEIDDSGLAANDRLRARRPDAEPYAMRIGYNAVYGFGVTTRYCGPDSEAGQFRISA